MSELRHKFEIFYDKVFKATDMYTEMVNTVEGSHWHREENVGVHTDMVVAEYIKRSPKTWTRHDVLGALTCAFHDVGKPIVQEMKNNAERGDYFTYKGHEQASARVFEEAGLGLIGDTTFGFEFDRYDVASVCWMIQNHLPYRMKKIPKIQALRETASLYGLDRVFPRVLLADQYGRISDDMTTNRLGLQEWLSRYHDMDSVENDVSNIQHKPRVFVLIGPSSAGKSTVTREMMTDDTVVYSLDQLRLDWYTEESPDWKTPAERYGKAFELACDDSTFKTRSNDAYLELLDIGKNVIVDNTNLTAKSRRFVCMEAMQKGYHVTCVVMQIKRDELLRRGRERNDRTIPQGILINMHDRLTYPNLVTECHNIIVR